MQSNGFDRTRYDGLMKEAEAMRASVNMPEATRQTDVTAQLGVQEHMVQELFEYAKKLESALTPVLRDHGPSGIEDPAPQPPLVPLAAKIQDNNERISAALATINSILHRLEL